MKRTRSRQWARVDLVDVKKGLLLAAALLGGLIL